MSYARRRQAFGSLLYGIAVNALLYHLSGFGQSQIGHGMRFQLLQSIRPGIVLAISTVVALFVVAATYPTFSNTYDEPAHLGTGLELLDRGTYHYEHHHPPLARLAIALGPYVAGQRSAEAQASPASDPTTDFWTRMAQGYDEGRRVLYEGGYDRTLTLARLGILPFLLVALVVTYAWTRSLLGDWPAVAATFLLATVPPFLGNAGIATLDVPVAALGVAAIWAFCRWLDRPVLWTTVALGMTAGGAIMTKFSAIPFLAVSFISIFAWRAAVGSPQRVAAISVAHLRTAIGVAATMLIVFWICYGLGFTSIADPSNRPYESIDNLLGKGSAASKIVSDIVELPVVPEFVPQMWRGIQDVAYHNRIGHRSFLLGEVQSQGWWYYYLVAFAVRTPLPLLAFGLIGLGWMLAASVRRRDWRLAAPALAFTSVLAFCSIYSKINLGVRHVLILYPLLAMAASYTAAQMILSLRRKAPAFVIVGCLLAAQAAISIRAFPDLMTYFNVIAGSAPERVLMPIDVDWGQDLKRLEAELRKRKVDRVAVSYYGSADLQRHDLPGYSPLVPHTPQTGWIAVSLWKLTRDLDYDWLRSFEPVARVGSSINLYHLTDEAAVANLAPVIMELAPGVFMRDKKRLHGSNQAFVEFNSYVVVFDPSTVIQARQLLEAIRARTNKPVRYAIISHFHPDHSAGAAVFAAAGAEIVASAAARPDFEGWLRRDFAGKTLSRPAEYAGLKYTTPSLYIDKTWALDDGVQRLEIIPTGHGHTTGDLVGWMPKFRILFAGDLSTDGYLNLSNANLAGWIGALERIRALDPRQVVLGHGSLAGPEALEHSARALVGLQSKVREMMGRGLTLDEIARWYSNSPTQFGPADVELAYTEAGGSRQKTTPPAVSKRHLAWLLLAGIVIALFFGVRRWNRRRGT
jgi:glyoxylase-like metal-dependent hydrolase (beta-lactamase superfamily II)/4-amino-4-deoxy-L-arabinose transferase-like glycosyltransferase